METDMKKLDDHLLKAVIGGARQGVDEKAARRIWRYCQNCKKNTFWKTLSDGSEVCEECGNTIE